MKTVLISAEALDSMQAQYTELKRNYAHLAALYAWTSRQRAEAEREVNRLLGLAQGSWGPWQEEIEHLYRVVSEQRFCCDDIDNVKE